MKTQGFTVKEMSPGERPQEKLFRKGAEALTNGELLALIFRTGAKGKSSLAVAETILHEMAKRDPEQNPMAVMARADAKGLLEVEGIGPAKASMILAAIELGKRLYFESTKAKIRVKSPQDALAAIPMSMKTSQVELAMVLLLDAKKYITGLYTISRGTVNMTVVHPREVFTEAVRNHAHSVILVHNHPSGDVTPSEEDRQLTGRVKRAGDILGIPLVDHLIVGDQQVYSFLQEGGLYG